jgi:hypothetical protein
VAAAVSTVVPKLTGTRAENVPSVPARAEATAVSLPTSVPAEAMSTRAPGAVVPVTSTVAPETDAPSAGAVIVSGIVPGAWVYRSRTAFGCSRGRPAPRSRASRTTCACAQVSGEAEPAAWPFTKPIEAFAGSVPYGLAGTSGFSHACSGTSPAGE